MRVRSEDDSQTNWRMDEVRVDREGEVLKKGRGEGRNRNRCRLTRLLGLLEHTEDSFDTFHTCKAMRRGQHDENER